MPERQLKRVAKYNLITGQDSYASQVAQNPQTSRRLLSMIPSQAGYLERQQQTGILFYANNNLPSKVGFLFEYDVEVGGSIQRYFFAATQTALYMLVGSTWQPVTSVNPLANYPTAVRVNNLMHLSDGVNAWIFDGTAWKQDGLQIPQGVTKIVPSSPPTGAATIVSISRTNGTVTAVVSGHSVAAGGWIDVLGVTGDPTFDGNFQVLTSFYNLGLNQTTLTWSQPGFPDSSPAASGTIAYQTFSVNTNKYYWTTFEDDSTTDGTESSSSPRSLGSGSLSNGVVTIYQRAGTINSAAGGATAIVGVGTDFSQSDVGLALFATENLSPTFSTILLGIIESVTDPQHLTLMTGIPGIFGITGGNFVIAPARATNWNIYCSGSENDNQGFFLASISILGAGNNFSYIDQSPFLGTAGTYINSILERPLRNDPPAASLISTVHKRRIFRRNEQFPNFFNYSAYEEVLAGGVGDPYQCVPGESSDTISDIVNETSYPDQSLRILNMIDYADSLFIGTETNCIPLFGESIDDFVLSQITAFSVGMAGRFSGFGCPYGLGFLSYDKKFYLWPSQWIAFYAPEETSQLIELSRPVRNNFQSILSADLDNVHAIWYNYGKRNWIVVTFQDNTSTYHTWVFDFEIKGWFELQPGFSSVAVFEPTFGNRVLVGGGTDGFVYVIDDQTGTFSGFNQNYPAGTYRPALIDFGNPDEMSVLQYIEYEVSNPNLNITVNYYLDPQDVDNPGTPYNLIMTKLKLGNNRYRGFFKGVPATCDRVLLEFLVASDDNNGFFRSMTLAAEPASKMANVPNPTGA